MSNQISIDRAPGSEGGITITVNLSAAALSALQADGQYSEALSEGQVSGAGPVLEKISFKVS
ncbi:hypothetical protein [Streptomyces sp. Rer75]|uniref:hypothetical protein n=1 Tax=unclassified Streptomyces TaxID=2593676 RepID=UPI0015D0A29E|nr:hypothetical protein [Streptomyces sp. Rer75]QLH25413.1 hypothetical protein HYQ63_36325 [Streptomyces sp. Rer75]